MSGTWQHPVANSTYEPKVAIGLCQLSTNSSNLSCDEKSAVQPPSENREYGPLYEERVLTKVETSHSTYELSLLNTTARFG